MADFAVRFNDFSGGDWGQVDPAKVKANQFSGVNVVPYGSGLLGVRAGWKLLPLTGKVAGGNPPNYTGIVRGFDLMRDHLTLVVDTKSYDIYWDLSLAPGGTLPAVAPATLPAGVTANALAHAQLLYSNDGGGVKEWLLSNGILCLKSAGATPAWQPLSTVGGATAPGNLSVLARWQLYLIGVDQAVPWRIRFTQVNEFGPNFLVWPPANYLDMSTTDPVTAVKGIFNLLYLGKASGWFSVSGVLGVLASVRELAIGNGPIDNRAASVTTDNRVVYWPVQKVPAFWNGERVQLIGEQRMDPRTTWLDATPVMARTAPGRGYTSQPWRILIQNQQAAGHGFDYLDTPTLLREIAPTWTGSAARGAESVGSFNATHNSPSGTVRPMPPGWSSFRFDSFNSVAPMAWTATDATNTAWRTAAGGGPVVVQGYASGSTPVPTGSALALFVNDVEVARTNVTTPTSPLLVRAELSFAANDVLSLRFYNPDPVNPYNFVDGIQLPANIRRPYLYVVGRPAVAAGKQMVCPATGRYDIHVETMGGFVVTGYQVLVNGKPIASCTCAYNTTNGTDDFTVNTIEANDVALTAGDVVGIGVLGSDYSQGYVDRADGPEGTAKPLLRITNRATQQQVGTLGMFGNEVAVTPTERRLLLAGDDGATTKIWSYGDGVWTHHHYGVLIAGVAPSDVRMSYLLPEHVVFATKRSYNAEPLKIWSIEHDRDRPAFVSDQWASPWDQSMQTGDVLVKGELSLPMWFDGQGRQVRVRSVVVQFVKWNQGVTDGVNQMTARVDSIGPYDRGITPGTDTTWSEPMSGAANTDDGTEDSWRFNVGEQGFGNGFQVVFSAMYGVAIREVVVMVDVRTERT